MGKAHREDVFEIGTDLDGKKLQELGKYVLSMRYVLTRKAEPQRGGQGYDKVPVEAKASLVTPGIRDLDNLEGTLREDAPTLTQE